MYLNKALIIGNLTRDPEVKALPSGIKVCTFSLATNRVYKDKNGVKVQLGKGTFGTVYAGRDLATQRQIAIKEVEIKNQDEVQPLMEEIQLHSTLRLGVVRRSVACTLAL